METKQNLGVAEALTFKDKPEFFASAVRICSILIILLKKELCSLSPAISFANGLFSGGSRTKSCSALTSLNYYHISPGFVFYYKKVSKSLTTFLLRQMT